MRLIKEGNRLVIAEGHSQVWIEPWGEHSLRIRMSCEKVMDANDWALTEPVKVCQAEINLKEIDVTDPWYQGEDYPHYQMKGIEATVTNGKITAKVSTEGWISYYNQKGEL